MKDIRIQQLSIPGVLLITPVVHVDRRGYFLENFNAKLFKAHGLPFDWKQTSQSLTLKKGTIRGLHYQIPWTSKLVWVSKGAIYDVVVDIRQNSPTYGKSTGAVLTDGEHNMLLAPEGTAHGFQALEDETVYHNMMTEFHNPHHDYGINPLEQGIEWPLPPVNLSDKDKQNPREPQYEY